MKKDRISGWSNVLINLFFCVMVVLCIYPILLVVSISFTDEKSLLANGYTILPSTFSTSAYAYLSQRIGSILNAYGVSIFVAVIGTVLSVLVNAMFAYAISRREFFFRRTFTVFIFVTMIFNGGMVPWYIVCVQVLHINDTIWALILPYLMNGFYVMILRTFFMTSIPDSLIESARIDGSGEFRTFFRIVFPLATPGIATVALFVVIAYWNDWWLPLMLVSKEHLFNIQYLLYRVLNQLNYLQSMSGSQSATLTSVEANLPTQAARMALCVVSIGPIILAYPYFQRYFIKGLTIGALKG